MHPSSGPIWQDQLAESLIQSINIWVNGCDTDLNILVWNPTAERICGYSGEEGVGHARCWEWFYPNAAQRGKVIAMTSHVLLEGYLTVAAAKAQYGVVLSDDLTIDAAATAAQRSSM